MKTFCIYDKNDFDGKSSAAIVGDYYPGTIFIPYRYDMGPDHESVRPEIFRDHRVYMVDVSMPAEAMDAIAKESNYFVWIDHHDTATDEIRKFYGTSLPPFTVETSDQKAACELTWEYLHNGPMPRAVRLLGRYDMWDHGYHDDVLPFQYGLRAHHSPMDPDDPFWEKLFTEAEAIIPVLTKGRGIRAYVENQHRAISKNASTIQFGGYTFAAVNAIGVNSKALDYFYDPEKHDALLLYHRTSDGRWKVSVFRPDDKGPEIDVSKIALSHGGGGRPGAAGFHCDELPIEILTAV